MRYEWKIVHSQCGVFDHVGKRVHFFKNMYSLNIWVL